MPYLKKAVIVGAVKPMKTTSRLKTKTKLKARPPKLRKKQPKPTITKLKKEADRWFSLATRYRLSEQIAGLWVCECVTCGVKKAVKDMQCGHFMSRRFTATRYSEENTAAQCYRCNVAFNGEQFKFGQAVDSLYGDGAARRLMDEASQPHRFTTEELLAIIEDSKKQVAWYEKETASTSQ